MRKLLLLIVTAALVSGCQSADEAVPMNSTPVSVTGPAAGAIAGDMASRLAERMGSSGTTTIKIDKDTSEYAAALEAALKGWGYTVITNGIVAKGQTSIDLVYSIDSFDGHVLARLTTPSIALGRVYTQTTAGATPASPLTIMQRN